MSPDFPDRPLTPQAGERLDAATTRRYRLRSGEDPAAEIRRVARGRVDSALEQLRRGARADVATAVQDTRKDLKKLRSLLRLVRGEVGEKRYRGENHRYRDAARQLSGPRDAEVKLATLADLRERFPSEAPAAQTLQRALERDHARIAAEGDALAERIGSAAEVLAAGRDAIDAWPLKSHGFDLVREGLERAYRRGRDRLGAVREDPTADAVHDWRKRVKDLWYQLRLLREAWPAGLEALSDEAHRLADLLGEHHDLSVLVEAARDEAPDEPDTGTLATLAERRQAELLDAALALGGLLYAERPRRFTRRIERYWEAWRA